MRIVIMAILALALAPPAAGFARPVQVIEGEAVAAGPASIRIGGALIDLWGVRGPNGGYRCLSDGELEDCAASGLALMQDLLDRNATVRCEVMGRTARAVTAKCFQVGKACYGATCEEQLEDLAAEQVGTGLAIQRRDVTRGAYDEQEETARYGQQGLWGEPHGGGLLPAAVVDEAGFAGDLGEAELKIVADLLEAYCLKGGPNAPPVGAGHANIASAGYTVEPGNPQALVKAGGLEIYLGNRPGPQGCALRVLRRSVSAATLDAWVKALPEGFQKTGVRAYEPGQGVTHFAADTGFGRQTLVVNRRGSEIEFTLSRAL